MFWLCQYMPVINSLLYHSKLYLQAMDCFICNGRTNWVLFINEITLEIYLDVQSRAVFTGCFSSNWPLLTWNKDYKVFASIHQAFYIPLPPPPPFSFALIDIFQRLNCFNFYFWSATACLRMCKLFKHVHCNTVQNIYTSQDSGSTESQLALVIFCTP